MRKSIKLLTVTVKTVLHRMASLLYNCIYRLVPCACQVVPELQSSSSNHFEHPTKRQPLRPVCMKI